jgi:hypothetical protein
MASNPWKQDAQETVAGVDCNDDKGLFDNNNCLRDSDDGENALTLVLLFILLTSCIPFLSSLQGISHEFIDADNKNCSSS